MGTVAAKDQVIVDLYCGIGYYTMPFLFHGNAKIVHAFEWNINSVASLIVNLSKAGIAKDRCVLHYGDNCTAVFGSSAAETGAVSSGVEILPAEPLPIDNYVGYTVRDVANESFERRSEWASVLADSADRVCLGLLPCSRGGWEAAVRVMKPAGGVLHVHYNVNADEIENWTNQMCDTFTCLFGEAKKAMSVECVHVEKVKSYAPRVYHIVADVICSPV